jgi:glycosyltransferase involved in cell wall biosynthesis
MGVIRSALRFLKPVLPKSLVRFYEEYRRVYRPPDRSEVILVAGPEYLPGYTPRLDPAALPLVSPVRVTVISTLWNEAANARDWLESLLEGSRRPEEIILVDGGSTDGTLQILQEYARHCPVPLKVISAPGANISSGRNLAIGQAAGTVVACSDFGCVLDRDWLKNLIAPFEAGEDLDLCAGYYQVGQEGALGRLTAHFFGIDLARINPQQFLPSGRSIALKKSLWEAAGGYPEWLTDAGEDTLFDLNAKSQPSRWAFVPGAVVTWRSPRSPGKLFKTYYRYSLGDGEAGALAELYWYKTVQFASTWLRRLGLLLLGLLLLLVLGGWAGLYFLGWLLAGLYRSYGENRASAAETGLPFFLYAAASEAVGTLQMLGFMAGVRNRPRVRERLVAHYRAQLAGLLEAHPDRREVIVYPPTHDWGFMFQRPHQMARAFARQGWLYFYCTANERTDAVFGFRLVEPGLYLAHVPFETFSILKEPVVYIGSPWNRACLPYFDRPRVVYDHYDDLLVSGGRPEDHQALLETASVVLTTSLILDEAVKPRRPDRLLAPNAVDPEPVECARPRPGLAVPDDLQPLLEAGRPIAGYSGALAEWFDYELLAGVARERADLQFLLVGVDYDGSLRRSGLLERENVRWLGLKPYDRLFHYIWHFDLGMIPFRVNQITQATSPIKLFEYMACRLPVVSTPLPECRRYPGVFLAEGAGEFSAQLDAALRAQKDPAYLETLVEIVQANTWASRAEAVAAALKRRGA